ncbi:MAG: hypothetical protein HZC36_02600 [Armatimonadetes bacterium]|nr:hypothetical protein [Armatimonadota bacterium]
MRRFRGFWFWAWTLAGLLAISGALLTLGRTDNESNPDSVSFGPSGLSAFAEVLRQEGYRVRSERGLNGKIDAKALVVACIVEQPRSAFEELDTEAPKLQPESPAVAVLRRHFQSGGTALVTSLPFSFVEATRLGESGQSAITDWIEAEESGKEPKPLAISGGKTTGISNWYRELPWLNNGGFWVRSDEDGNLGLELVLAEKGRMGFVSSGIGATNRFLSRADNATFWVQNVRTLAPPGSEVVFLEAAHGTVEEPSLILAIGEWAQAAWWQTGIMVLVLFLTLGKRFGLPSQPRGVEMGSKDLADALSSVMRRGKASPLAVEVLLKRMDRELRWKLKLPVDSPRQRRDELLPDALKAAIHEAEVLSKERGPRGAALAAMRRLEAEVRSFLGTGSDFR